MPSVRRSRLEVLRVLDYAGLHGVEAAAEHFRIDPRTIRRWVELDPPGWERDEELMRAEMAARRISGKVTYRDLVVGAGIAFDKAWRIVRRKEAEARRQAAVEAEKPAESPTKELLDRLDDKRQQLVVRQIDLALQRNKAEGTEPAEPMDEEKYLAVVTELVEHLLTETDEQVDQWLAEVKAEQEKLREWIASVARQEAAERDAQRQAELEARQARTPSEAPQSPQTPAASPRTPQAPAKPPLRVMDDIEEHWAPYARWHIE